MKLLRETKNIALSPFEPLMFKVKAITLTVRSGPKMNYETIGYLKKK